MQMQRLVLGELATNCYIVWDTTKNALVIDPADELDAIMRVLQREKITVKAVALTHAHFDHMLAAEALCRATGAPLYVGRGDADAMTDPVRNLSGLFTPQQSLRLAEFLMLCEGDSLSIGDLIFTVLETPGHTPGCICLQCGDILFSGDTLFKDSIGRLDFPGGDTAAMLASLRRLVQLEPDTTVYPGHGPSTTIGREIRCNPYLQ